MLLWVLVESSTGSLDFGVSDAPADGKGPTQKKKTNLNPKGLGFKGFGV